MVSRAASRMLEQHRAVAHHRHGRMQVMGLAAQAPRAARAPRRGRPAWKNAGRPAPGSGRRRAPGGPASAPRPHLAFSRASRAATVAGASCAGARFDRALVDIGGHDLDRDAGRLPATRGAPCFSTRAPAAGSEPQRHRSRHRLPAAVGQQRHHRGRGFLDRAASHVDDRPVVPGAELARRTRSRRPPPRGRHMVVVVLRRSARAAGSGGSARCARGSRQPDHQRLRQASRASAAPACSAPAEHSRSSRRGWRDRSRSASSTCARRRPAPRRPVRDRRYADRRHAAWCSSARRSA